MSEDYDNPFDLTLEPYEGEVIPDREAIRNIAWPMANGGSTRLKDMNDHHLKNSALKLIGMGAQSFKVPDDVKFKWLACLRIEWEHRLYERNAHKVR